MRLAPAQKVMARIPPTRAALATALLLGLGGFRAPSGAQEVSTPPPDWTLPESQRPTSESGVPWAPEGAPAPSLEEQVVALVNQERQNCADAGCPKPPLKYQPNLTAAAEEHSQSMALNDYFSHSDWAAGCISVGTRMTNAGYSPWNAGGENIAAGNATAAAVMAQWMGSSGHRANILSSSYRDLGVGYFPQAGDLANVRIDSDGDCQCADEPPTGVTQCPNPCAFCALTHYWTQVFGRRDSHPQGYPVVIDREAYSTATPLVDLYLYQPPGTGPQMRFANETGDFSAPETFNNNVLNWSLTPGDGRKTVIALVTTSSGTFRTCDRIWLDGSGNTSFVFAEGFECDGLAAWSAVVGGS